MNLRSLCLHLYKDDLNVYKDANNQRVGMAWATVTKNIYCQDMVTQPHNLSTWEA